MKNTLAERAGAGTPAEGLLKNLTGTNSIAYTKTDPVALAKILTKVAKDVPAFQFRAGFVEGRVLSIAEIKQLALASVQGRTDQQGHVPAECSGAAHCIGAGRSAAQSGRGHQRSSKGEQIRRSERYSSSSGNSLICI